MKVSIQTLGGDKIFSRLSGMGKAANKIVKKAMGEAGKIILKEAKGGIPRESGLLKKSMGRKVKVYRGSGAVVAIVGPRTGFVQIVDVKGLGGIRHSVLRDPTKYAHLVEGGTKPHSLQKRGGGGQRRGPQTHPGARPHPFLGRAIKYNEGRIVDAVSETITAGLDAEAAK
jgi:HK97 gp10 family phage protein